MWRIFLVLVAFAPCLAFAQPRVDCGKASTDVERAICADAKLGAADRALAAAYGALVAKLSGPARDHLVKDQQGWLDARGRACTVLAGCLDARYRQRLATLQADGAGAYPFVSEQSLFRTGAVKAIRYEIDARYPQFDGPGADFTSINNSFAQAAAAGALDATPRDTNDTREQRWLYLQGFELDRPGPNAVSVLVTSYIFTGGAHGSNNATATLVDLASGRSVKPGEVFVEESPWRRTIAELARADLKKQFVERPGFEDALEPAKFDKLMEESSRYLFKAGALELIFNQYEIGPGAAGRYAVTIPYARLGGLIRTDGLVQLAPVAEGRGGR
jgi:uncharacterized protein